MITDKTLKRIVKGLSLKYFMRYDDMELICEAQFKLIRDKIAEGKLEGVSCIGLGRFVPKLYSTLEKVESIKENKERKLNEARV